MILTNGEQQVFQEAAKEHAEIIDVETAGERVVRWLPHESIMMMIFDRYGSRLSTVRCQGRLFLPYRRGREIQGIVVISEFSILTAEKLEPDERQELVDAVAALTAVSEPVELILDQERAGHFVDREWINRLRAQGAEPANRIAKIVSSHPGSLGIWFRDRLYLPFPGNVGLISESAIETIEG